MCYVLRRNVCSGIRWRDGDGGVNELLQCGIYLHTCFLCLCANLGIWSLTRIHPLTHFQSVCVYLFFLTHINQSLLFCVHPRIAHSNAGPLRSVYAPNCHRILVSSSRSVWRWQSYEMTIISVVFDILDGSWAVRVRWVFIISNICIFHFDMRACAYVRVHLFLVH